MDGTLLDLHFDNHFWLTYLPKRYAQHHNVCLDQATRELHAKVEDKRGTLDWYCLEYWSNELDIDVRELKTEIRHMIQERPFAQDFLAYLSDQGKERILITNAHPHGLELKLQATGIEPLLDQIISSHQYRSPKEDQSFWQQLHQQLNFDPSRTLFVDDTERILDAARQFGIKHLLCIHQPDSRKDHRQIDSYPAIDHFDELIPASYHNSRPQHG